MADEQIRIDITAEDDASAVLDDVADEAAELERLTPEVTVGADTDAAVSGIAAVGDDAEALSRRDWEIVLRARIDEAKGNLAELRTNLDTTGEKADQTARQLDRVGDDGGGGIRTRGNAIADLTGPLGDASGAASDFAGVFEGIGDIAEDVAGKVGLNAAVMSTAIGGIGIAVAAGAAAWAFFKQRQEEARRKQEELVKGQRAITDAIREGDRAAAAKAIVEMYDEAFEAADRLGVSVESLTAYLTGQSRAIPELTAAQEDLNARILDSYGGSEQLQEALRAEQNEYFKLRGEINGARDQYITLNGSIADQDRVLGQVEDALGRNVSATEAVTRANERTERQADRTRDAFDRIRGGLDIQAASLSFTKALGDAFTKAQTEAGLTSDDILQIKQDILDAATFAGLTPIEVRSLLQRIDNGEVLQVMADVNGKLATKSAQVPVDLLPPSPADLARLNRQIANGLGPLAVSVVFPGWARSGNYGALP